MDVARDGGLRSANPPSRRSFWKIIESGSRSNANLNRTHAPSIARSDAPVHDVAAFLIVVVIAIVVIGVIRIVIVVVVGIGSPAPAQADRATDEERSAEAMVKAATVKSPRAREPTRAESCATESGAAVESADPADRGRSERPAEPDEEIEAPAVEDAP